MTSGVHSDHTRPREHNDALLGPELRRSNQDLVEPTGPRQVILRQGRALVRQFRLLPHNADGSLKAQMTQSDRRRCTPMTGAHNENIEFSLPIVSHRQDASVQHDPSAAAPFLRRPLPLGAFAGGVRSLWFGPRILPDMLEIGGELFHPFPGE